MKEETLKFGPSGVKRTSYVAVKFCCTHSSESQLDSSSSSSWSSSSSSCDPSVTLTSSSDSLNVRSVTTEVPEKEPSVTEVTLTVMSPPLVDLTKTERSNSNSDRNFLKSRGNKETDASLRASPAVLAQILPSRHQGSSRSWRLPALLQWSGSTHGSCSGLECWRFILVGTVIGTWTRGNYKENYTRLFMSFLPNITQHCWGFCWFIVEVITSLKFHSNLMSLVSLWKFHCGRSSLRFLPTFPHTWRNQSVKTRPATRTQDDSI